MSRIRSVVPLGFKHHNRSQGDQRMPDPVVLGFDPVELPVVSREYESALRQVGTLGGGNHFIEIQKGDDGFIWIMIHSGSRNIGKQVADYYNRKAVSLNREAGKIMVQEQNLHGSGSIRKPVMIILRRCSIASFLVCVTVI